MKKSDATVKTNENGFLVTLYDLFRSVKLTIFLLILLAILSIIGTLIAQDATRAEYIQRYGHGLYEVLNFFNLFDMYRSLWFRAILVLLIINLVACSLHRFPGAWKQITREPGTEGLKDSMLKALPYVEKVPSPIQTGAKTEEEIRSFFKRWVRSPRRIENESAITLYSEKGRFSRLGVYITHLSILIILIGGLIGSQFGFKGFVNILEGETVDQIYERGKNGEIPRPLGFSVRCDDFNVTYYDLRPQEKQVKEYISQLTILENGKEILKKIIRVNHPLHYKGLAFYQSTYGNVHEITLGIKRNGKEITYLKAFEGVMVKIPDTDNFIRVLQYAPQVHNFGEGVQVALFKPNQEPQPFWLLRNFPKFDEKRGDKFLLTFEGMISKEYTGLQVAKDPGVWVVWIGCGLMILGLIVSFFFSHQRVWVRIPKDSGEEIVLAGSVNKNRMGFEKTFGELVEGVRSLGKK